jgi:hypothetical protein
MWQCVVIGLQFTWEACSWAGIKNEREFSDLFLCNQKSTGVLGPKSFPGSVGRNEEQ